MKLDGPWSNQSNAIMYWGKLVLGIGHRPLPIEHKSILTWGSKQGYKSQVKSDVLMLFMFEWAAKMKSANTLKCDLNRKSQHYSSGKRNGKVKVSGSRLQTVYMYTSATHRRILSRVEHLIDICPPSGMMGWRENIVVKVTTPMYHYTHWNSTKGRPLSCLLSTICPKGVKVLGSR